MQDEEQAFGKLRNMATVYLTAGDKVLLLYRQGSRVINDVWTGSAGGHFEPGELNDPRTCVMRELREELSVTEDMVSGLRLRYITLRRVNGEIRQNYYFFAELRGGPGIQLRSSEGVLQWFPMGPELNALEMPFSARFMMRHYLSLGRYTAGIYCGAAGKNAVSFEELA